MASFTSADAARNPFTITRYILQEQKKYPNAKGDLTIILNSVTLAIKIIAAAATGAGIFQRYGVEKLKHEEFTVLPTDPKDEDEDDESKEQEPKKEEEIREFAYESILSSIGWCGKIPMMLSTLDASTPINVKPCETPKYILVFDPVDGKQNIQINGTPLILEDQSALSLYCILTSHTDDLVTIPSLHYLCVSMQHPWERFLVFTECRIRLNRAYRTVYNLERKWCAPDTHYMETPRW